VYKQYQRDDIKKMSFYKHCVVKVEALKIRSTTPLTTDCFCTASTTYEWYSTKVLRSQPTTYSCTKNRTLAFIYTASSTECCKVAGQKYEMPYAMYTIYKVQW